MSYCICAILWTFMSVLQCGYSQSIDENDIEQCPPGFNTIQVEKDVVCLNHVFTPKRWDDAMEYCQSLGAEMYSAYTRQDMDILLYYHRGPFYKTVYINREKSLFYWHWIAADVNPDMLQPEWMWHAGEGGQNTTDTLVRDTPTYWDYQEPSILDERGCLLMVAGLIGEAHDGSYKYRWKANGCISKRPFVCRIFKKNK